MFGKPMFAGPNRNKGLGEEFQQTDFANLLLSTTAVHSVMQLSMVVALFLEQVI